jgi:ABC-type lipoprotein release transport system permease subunit
MQASSRWRKVFVWIMAGFCTIGVLFGVSTLAAVWFVMDALRQDARGSSLDLVALSDQQQSVMKLVLALIVLVAAINIVTGFALLLKRAQQRR